MHHKEYDETDTQSALHPGGLFPNHLCGRCLLEEAFVRTIQPFWPEPPWVVGTLLQRRRRHPGQHQRARPTPGLGSRSHDITFRHRLSVMFKERGDILHGTLTHPGCSPQASRYPAIRSLSGHYLRSLDTAKYTWKLTLSSDGKSVNVVNHGSLKSDHNTKGTTHETLHSIGPI